ncbi:MAG: hypothetical protein AAF611_20625 [Bacteroidota bacterium]
MYSKNIPIDYGVQMIFSTIPNQEGIDFEAKIEDSHFRHYKDKVDDNSSNFLYKPLKFYMLGDYDVLYISLINNFKFSHRLFIPKRRNTDNEEHEDLVYTGHSFQSYSGLSLNEKYKTEQLFKNGTNTDYIGVINLKLNNGLLIGNGLTFIEAVHNFIKCEMKERNISFFLVQTFSWFELSLVVFLELPNQLKELVKILRNAKFEILVDYQDSLKNNSLYNSFFEKNQKRIYETSIFSDTHTSFGFNEKLINNFDESDKNRNKYKNIKLNTEIQWHVKPGHINQLIDEIRGIPGFENHFELDQQRLILGKSDYLIQEKLGNVLCNIDLLRILINKRPKANELYKHCRRIRSYVFFEENSRETRSVVTNSNNSEPVKPFLWGEKLDGLGISAKTIRGVEKNLKSLKVSRHIRIKILKVITYYNNGIQDPILFPYFLDFKVFTNNLIETIGKEFDTAEKRKTQVRIIEKRLDENIKIFQRGYHVRFLNGYYFENMSNFNLDFNSSIQQLLSSYGTLVYEYGKSFNLSGKYAPIILLNDIDTISTHLAINYSVHHLTSPEFVFSTISKEILNSIKFHDEEVGFLILEFNNNIEKIKTEINESYLDEMIDSKLFNVMYFIIDCVRLGVRFNFNFKLFEYWFWTYNFQNATLFNSNGTFNEERLRMEMLRLRTVMDFFNIEDEMKCPSNDIYTNWDRHQDKIKIISKKVVKSIKALEVNYLNKETKTNIKITYLEKIHRIIFEYFQNFDLGKSFRKNNKDIIDREKHSKDIGVILNLNYISEKHSLRELVMDKLYILYSDTEFNELYKIERLMHQLLTNFYQKNKKLVTSLNRDWKKGNIIKEFNVLYKDILFPVDQTGGVFFADTENANIYFRENAKSLLQIIDFSLKNKKRFIEENLNEANR